MILWFAGGACLLVLLVFGDPRIDYRMVAAGALVPDVVGRMTPLHSLPVCALALVVVMLATRGRRGLRRRLLAVPIGMLLHLVLDGMWARTDVFWWPFFGEAEWGRLPSLERPVAVLLMQEAAGAAALVWVRSRVREARAAC